MLKAVDNTRFPNNPLLQKKIFQFKKHLYNTFQSDPDSVVLKGIKNTYKGSNTKIKKLAFMNKILGKTFGNETMSNPPNWNSEEKRTGGPLQYEVNNEEPLDMSSKKRVGGRRRTKRSKKSTRRTRRR